MTAQRDSNLGLVFLCFFLSGFAALLYQTAWTREFAFVFGTSDLAVAAVLAAYMGGLALGAAIAARLAPTIRRPVLVYGLLELGIALCALAVPYGIRGIGALTAAVLGGGETGSDPGVVAAGIRLAIAFSLLLPPTALMGATLPLLARYAVHTDAQVGPRIGALYSINTAGAIFGTICAAFFLLPAIGLRLTVYCGAAVNGLVFVAAALVARRSAMPVEPAVAPRSSDATEATSIGLWVLPMMTVSGAVSFAYEVLWTRLLSQILGGSVYAFSTMLASFLLGITIGSAIAARLAKTRAAAVAGFAWAQIGTAVLVLCAFAMADLLPEIARTVGASGTASGPRNAVLAGVVLLPFAICIGATFPFAVRIVSTSAESSAGATARVYAWNTVGSIVGSIGAGFFLLPRLGFAGLITLGCALNLALAAAACLAATSKPRVPLMAAAIGVIALAVVPVSQPWKLLRTVVNGETMTKDITYFAIGRSSTVMMVDDGTEWWLMTNGLRESVIEKPGSFPRRGLAERWLGLLGPLLRADTENALVIGLGGGVALEAVPPSIESVDVIELEPQVVAANRVVSDGRMIDPLANPHARILINDARGALMLSSTRYDSIVSQPSHPWTAGASHLYTREFFELVRDHLTPDGVFVQWIDVTIVDEALLKTLIRTLCVVYDHVEIYAPTEGALLFAASTQPLDIVASAEAAIARAPEHYARYGISSTEDVASYFMVDAAESPVFGKGAQVNTDDMNLLATRSARLGRNGLKPSQMDELLGEYDPLPKIFRRLNRGLLWRILSEREGARQLDRLLGSLGRYDRAMALGWKALAGDNENVARRYFESALKFEPGDANAYAGLAVSGGTLDADAPAHLRALARASELWSEEDYEALASLDEDLARFGPESPVYAEATRLRAHWRLEVGGPERGAEALELVDRLLARGTAGPDYWLRARAAVAAGRPDAAWTVIVPFAQTLKPSDEGLEQAREVLDLVEGLPNGKQHPVYEPLKKMVGRS